MPKPASQPPARGLYQELASALRAAAALHGALQARYPRGNPRYMLHGEAAAAATADAEYWERIAVDLEARRP